MNESKLFKTIIDDYDQNNLCDKNHIFLFQNNVKFIESEMYS